MIAFMWNLLLALIWVVLTGTFNGYNFLVGFLLGYASLSILQRHIGILNGYSRRLPNLVRFVFFFFKELVRANFKVAFDVVTPIWYMKPGVIALPLEARTDMEITLVANLISLTPGTLSLDVSDDRRVLFIHAMFMENEEELRAELKEMERRALEILR
ncbi:Na+/H+ antiporter subunit E [Marinospirillum alkaliphilum]|uniref:Multicomponent Na+:H+ antiporter subunit E n=1 Tax=Marinospirillum alkaliphilum DSM 21637 TaxID=1122209 RepID=A0A1K1ZH66_9GAMM|nr:Na+/H+ antiporter subunit E [Marinospirillum alkaliphilum]SFX73043.1 multicomponent Na+:H+ antiporter subunit E [Marinospirillum alkaliphilum DSM 21637]